MENNDLEYKKIIRHNGEPYSIWMNSDDVKGVMDKLSEFYAKHGVCGEVLSQSDEPCIEAVHLISHLCDYYFKIAEVSEVDKSDKP